MWGRINTSLWIAMAALKMENKGELRPQILRHTRQSRRMRCGGRTGRSDMSEGLEINPRICGTSDGYSITNKWKLDISVGGAGEKKARRIQMH